MAISPVPNNRSPIRGKPAKKCREKNRKTLPVNQQQRTSHLARKTPDHQKIGWVLFGDEMLASSRLQGLLINDILRRKGLNSHIAAINVGKLPNRLSTSFVNLAIDLLQQGFTTLFFQKPSWMMCKLSELLRLNGVATAAIQCDPLPCPYEKYFDRVVVTSKALKKKLDLEYATVIDDMIEVPSDLFKKQHRVKPPRLKLVWVGQKADQELYEFIEALRAHPRLHDRIEIVTIGRGDWMTHQWTSESVHLHVIDSDIAILPQPQTEWQGTKSTNRLTLFMALGMPVIASPVQSYLETGQAERAFLVARSLDDFADQIVALADVQMREKLALDGRRFALANYGEQSLSPLWMGEVQALSNTIRYNPSASSAGIRAAASILGFFSRLNIRPDRSRRRLAGR